MKVVYTPVGGVAADSHSAYSLVSAPDFFPSCDQRELDEWLRHRLRAIQLKQCRRGKTIYRELRVLVPNPGLPDKWRPTAGAGGVTAGCCSTAC